ncbi:MAG: DUF308 domain-containing protein [Bacteroidales bacterium]|nr:DUF308 domain-containing protein [Bacteroidales bacterium]
MITFGYKSRLNGPLRALTAIAIGVVMVVSKTNALELAVRIIAAFLLASGIVSLLIGYKNRQNGTMGLMGFNGGVDIFLGILLFLFPGFVAGLMIYIIGFVLVVFGLFQVVALISANRVMSVGLGSFILPVLVFLAGSFLILRPSFVGDAVGVIAGASLIVYGASELLSSWKMRRAMDEYDIKFPEEKSSADSADKPQVKDVEFEKIDEQ